MRTSLLCLAATFTFAAMAQVPSYVPMSGLVAWYPMDNSVGDAGPNGLNGTANGITAAINRSGVQGTASYFAGFSYGQVLSSPLFNTGAEMTITAWVNLVSPFENQKIMGRVNGSFNSGFILGVENGQVHPEVWNSAGVAHAFSAGSIPASTWAHLAITWATNGYLTAYVNGVAVDSIAAGASPIGTNTEPLIIGGSPWSQSPLYFPVQGSIDDIGIWDRALTPTELMAVYNSVTTGIGQLDTAGELVLYPNPAGSSVSITSAPQLAGQSYQVVDATGRTVIRGTLGQGLTNVGVEGLSSGIYTVLIGDTKVDVRKLVKR